MKTIRWGIIGCGDVTEVKSGPGFQKSTGSSLVAVMRRDGAKAADYARRHGVPRWYDDADALIADADVDAVYIATPPDVHELYAMRVCAAGKPCYVEKPVSRNVPEAQRMVKAFADRKLPLFVAYYRRGQPRFVKAREIIQSGVLGAIHTVSYRFNDDGMRRRQEPVPWRLAAETAGGGLFLDIGSHALDLLDWMAGPLTEVRGRAENRGGQYDLEDHVELEFKTTLGSHGTAVWSLIEPERFDEYLFAGDRGELRFSCFGKDPVRISRPGGGVVESFDIPYPPHVGQPLIQLMVDELRGAVGACPSTGVSALRTQQVMDIALEGFYGGREDGFWKRPRASGAMRT